MSISPLVKKLVDIVRSSCKFVSRDFHEIQKIRDRSAAAKFFGSCCKKISSILLKELKSYEVYVGNEYEFAIFPISGRANFICGMPFFSVAVLAKKNNEAVACVIESPISCETFWAEQNACSYIEDSIGITKLRVSNVDVLGNSIILVNDSCLMDGGLNYRCLGSSILSAAYLSVSRADALILNNASNLHNDSLLLCKLLIKESGGSCNEHDDKLIFSNSRLADKILER